MFKAFNPQTGAEQTLAAADVTALGFVAGGVGATGVVGVAAGYKIARGSAALAAGTLAAATGLTTIVAAVAQIRKATSPVLGTCVLTTSVVGATLNIFGWKPTGAGDCTLIATDGTETVDWVAIGT